MVYYVDVCVREMIIYIYDDDYVLKYITFYI